jgi:hypothetical protein
VIYCKDCKHWDQVMQQSDVGYCTRLRLVHPVQDNPTDLAWVSTDDDEVSVCTRATFGCVLGEPIG